VHTASFLVRRLFDQAFNQGNLAIVDELFSADLSTHMAGWGMPGNRLGIKQMIANLRSAFPDMHCTIENKIVERDQIAALWKFHGTHIGVYFGNRPTGKTIEVQGFICARIKDGQFVENWILIDQMDLLQQLGIVPPPRGSI